MSRRRRGSRIHEAQQADFFALLAAAGTAPTPSSAVDLTAASCAQHALVPAGAGPPQQPVSEPWSLREFFASAFCLSFAFMLISPLGEPLTRRSNMKTAADHDGRRISLPPGSPCVLFDDVPSL